MNTSAYQSRRISISPERFALGAIVLYVLNFWAIALVAVITPFALVLGGLLLKTLGVVHAAPMADKTELRLAVITILACLVSVAAVGLFFYWGAKSILRGRAVRAVVFLALLVALHVLWVLWFGFGWVPINWFNVAIGCFSIALITVRRKRLFT